jgi:hypothetical protein
LDAERPGGFATQSIATRETQPPQLCALCELRGLLKTTENTEM